MNDIVLLHGALGASRQLDPLADALRPRFRVHQLDFEGHADSPDRGRPYGVESFGENVLELLDTRGIVRADIFGYSMGGYVAVHLAARHPDRVARVTSLGTKFRWDPATAARESARLDPAVIRAKVPRFAETLEARHARTGGWESVLSRTAAFLAALGDDPPLTDAMLAQIEHPVRIMVGERDTTVSIEEATEVAGRLRYGAVTVLADTPHPIEQVKVEALVAALTGPMANVPARV